MSDQTGFYPVDTIAALLNLRRRRVQQLAQAGIIPKAERGQYPLAGCVNGYVRNLQLQAESRAPSDLDQHRTRLLEARTRKLKAENDAREVGLIRFDEAHLALQMVVAVFEVANKALLRRKLLDELVAIDNPAVIRARLKDEVHAVRTQAADRLNALVRQRGAA
ncbi:MAG: hypothetical protein ACREVE_05950 [Gammaproteobacteria bacterium]